CAGRILDSVFKVEREKLPDRLPAPGGVGGEEVFLHDVSGLFHGDASLCEIAAQTAAFSYYVVKKAMMPRKACPMGAARAERPRVCDTIRMQSARKHGTIQERNRSVNRMRRADDHEKNTKTLSACLAAGAAGTGLPVLQYAAKLQKQ